MTTLTNKNVCKQAVGKAAAALVEHGMCIGLGTGSTAACLIEHLIERMKNEGLKFTAIASSERSAAQARNGGIILYDIDQIKKLDLAIDGADEVDHSKQLIKGGGGALLREKIVASMSREFIIIVDEEKVVDQLGGFPLPLEIVPFAHQFTLNKICSLGYQAKFRTFENELYKTDNGNYIIDITYKNKCLTPQIDQAILSNIPGVVETGFFFNMVGRVMVGHTNGHVTTF